MKLLLYIAITLALFATLPVVTVLGIKVLYVFTYSLIMILAIVNIFTNRYLFITRTGKYDLSIITTFWIIIWGLLMLILKIGFNDYNGSRDLLYFLIVPMLVFLLLDSQNSNTKKKIANIILFFLVVECFLATLEFMLNYNFFNEIRNFDSELVDFGFGEFRSTAFLGNPLANALCVSIMMGFILTSSMKLYKKIFFLLIGHIALLSFNGRGALLVWTFIDFIFIISVLRIQKLRPVAAFTIIISTTIVAFVLYFLMENYGFGGRLVNTSVVDGSTQVRLQLEGSFEQLNGMDFLFGSSEKYLSVLSKGTAVGSENLAVALIFKYGIIAFLVMFCLYFFWIKAIIKSQTLFHKIIILSSFIVVGSTNNGLTDFTPWLFFVLCTTMLSTSTDTWNYKMNRQIFKR